MFKLKLSKKSLHYRIATVYGNFQEWNTQTDLCEYTHQVIRGSIFILLITVLCCGIFGFLGGSFLAWVVWMIVNGTTIAASPESFGGMVLFVGMTGILTLLLISAIDCPEITDKLNLKVRKFKKAQDKWFIVQAYRNFKDKTCVLIELD